MTSVAAPRLTVTVSAGLTHARPPLLRRAVAALCARADLPVDRIDDALLMLDALLADQATKLCGDLRLRLTARPNSVEMRVGPLAVAGADGLLERAGLPRSGSVIDRLATRAASLDQGRELLIVIDAR